MARAQVEQNSCFPYHITARCPNRGPFGLNLDTVWWLMSEQLYFLNKKYGLKIHSFVLMPNHFHLLASTREFSIGCIMRELMSNSSQEINRLAGKINQNWGNRHFKCVLDNPIHFLNAYKYVYQNPLRANLCARAEDWKYSTLHGILGRERLLIPIEEDSLLFNPEFRVEELEWINRPIKEQDKTSIRVALTRRKFTLPKTFQRLNILETARA